MNLKGRLIAAAAGLAIAVAAGVATPGAAEASAPAVRTYTGHLNGAAYRVEIPRSWNGTLVLWSHGDYTNGYAPPPDQINLANQPATAHWLLDHGYALAGSNYRTPDGFVVTQALTDQTALLNWYEARFGRPRQVIAAGNSMGGLLSVLLAERDPGRFSGVLSECGAVGGGPEIFNRTLDLQFALKTLLAPGTSLQLVHITDPAADNAVVNKTITTAMTSASGRARLALANALADVPGWYRAAQPPPATVQGQITQQAQFDQSVLEPLAGPTGRAILEAEAGGNPSANAGVDYRYQLTHSNEFRLVRQAYRQAGLSLNADLRRLRAAPRVHADAGAAAWLSRNSIPAGTTPVPLITLHGTTDGGVGAEAEQWYAAQVKLAGHPASLRQVFVHRGGHCSFTGAEEIVALRSLRARLDSGRWPALDPAALNSEALGLGPAYQQVVDWASGLTTVKPAFVTDRPGRLLRPSPHARPCRTLCQDRDSITRWRPDLCA